MLKAKRAPARRFRSLVRHFKPNVHFGLYALAGRPSHTEYFHVAWVFVLGLCYAYGNADCRQVCIPTSVLFVVLTSLAIFDARYFILPYVLLIVLALAGIPIAIFENQSALADRAAGALVGFVIIKVIALTYKHVRGLEGLGDGDAKLAGACAIWIGMSGLPSLLIWAALSGMISILVLWLRGEQISRQTAIPFGPHLALGAWLVWLLGPFVR